MSVFDDVNMYDPGSEYEFIDTRDNIPYPDAANITSGNSDYDVVVNDKNQVVDSAGNVIGSMGSVS